MIDDTRTERECPRCRYHIHPGYYHREIPQPEGASHVVCALERARHMLSGPLVEVLKAYFEDPDSDGTNDS